MNVPFACVGLALVLVYLPKLPMALAIGKTYDNHSPREQQATMGGWGARARNAHANGFESFPAFGIAVAIATLAHVSPTWLDRLSITYVLARTVYPVLYIKNLASLRSAVWFIGFAATLGLFALAALA